MCHRSRRGDFWSKCWDSATSDQEKCNDLVFSLFQRTLYSNPKLTFDVALWRLASENNIWHLTAYPSVCQASAFFLLSAGVPDAFHLWLIHAWELSWSRLSLEVYQLPQPFQIRGLEFILSAHRIGICSASNEPWVPTDLPGYTTFYFFPFLPLHVFRHTDLWMGLSFCHRWPVHSYICALNIPGLFVLLEI